MFRESFERILVAEGLSQLDINKIMREYSEIEYSKTDSKVVLGSMNDLAFHYEIHIRATGGVDSYQIPNIIKKLNRLPMEPLKIKYAIKALEELYDSVL